MCEFFHLPPKGGRTSPRVQTNWILYIKRGLESAQSWPFLLLYTKQTLNVIVFIYENFKIVKFLKAYNLYTHTLWSLDFFLYFLNTFLYIYIFFILRPILSYGIQLLCQWMKRPCGVWAVDVSKMYSDLLHALVSFIVVDTHTRTHRYHAATLDNDRQRSNGDDRPGYSCRSF